MLYHWQEPGGGEKGLRPLLSMAGHLWLVIEFRGCVLCCGVKRFWEELPSLGLDDPFRGTHTGTFGSTAVFPNSEWDSSRIFSKFIFNNPFFAPQHHLQEAREGHLWLPSTFHALTCLFGSLAPS